MANKKFQVPVNLVNLASDPVSASEGDIYYNTVSDTVKVYANGAWASIGSGGGASLTQEEVQDYVAPLFTHANHTNASVTYEDASNELRINVVNAPSAGYTSTLKHDVRLNGAIAKGQAVYVSSSNGTNMVVSKASNASEATSSKTLGLLETGGANNELVKVITEGLLAGLDTSTAGTEGDPVWLGTDGNLIYGLTNKPVAPAHLVFIGVVTRKNANNGEIFVKAQNGFELEEIHNVGIGYGATIADNEVLAYDSTSSLWINQTSVEAGLLDTSATAQTKTGNLTLTGTNSIYDTREYLYAVNDEGETVSALSAVVFNGVSSGVPKFKRADTDQIGQSGVVGLTIASIASGATGTIITRGIINGVNTASYADGQILYISTGGLITGTRPTGTTSRIHKIGKVVIADETNGIIYVLGTIEEDLPNLENLKIWVGNSSDAPTETTLNTTVVPEGTNIYFTDERAQDAIGNNLGSGLSYNDSTGAISNSGVLSIIGTANEIDILGTNAEIQIGIPNSPVFVTPNIGAATATSVNGTTIPSSKTLVVTTDIGSTVQAYDADLGAIAALTGTSGLLTTNGSGTWSVDTNTYSTTAHNHSIDSLSNVVITGTPTDGQAIVWDTTTSKWVNETVSNGAVLDTLGSSYISLGQGSGFLKYTRGALGSFPTWSLDTTTYLTSESDTLETVTDRGASSTNAITISNTTQSTTPTTGALIISGGVGIAKDVWIDGDLHVNGTTVTENTKTVATNDNLIYLNAAQDSVVTNAVGNGTYVTYTAENNYTPGMDIRVTGMNPAGYNIATSDLLTVYSATSTQFVVAKTTTGTFVSGGTAHAKEEVNPDLGFAGGYYNAGYAHAGLFRDATDGVFKFFQGYTPEPDEAVNIDTTHASFALANIAVGDLAVNGGDITSSASTVNLFTNAIDKDINIGYASNFYTNTTGLFYGYLSFLGGFDAASYTTTTFNNDVKVAGPTGNLFAKYGFFDEITVVNALPYSIGGTGLTTLGTAGQVLKVNSGATGLEWGTASGGGPSTTPTSISVNTAVVIESFAISASRTAEAIIQITQGTDYYSSKILLIHDGTNVKITEYAILESTVGAIPVTISAAISDSNVELRATITDAGTTNATAKVIMTEVAV